jgi:hypothetical protein
MSVPVPENLQGFLLACGFILTLIMAVIGVFKFFSAEITAVRATESKARLDMRNEMTGLLGVIGVDIRTLETNASQLAIDAVRKADIDKIETARRAELAALEVRVNETVRDTKVSLTAEIRRLEENRRDATDKLDVKLTRLTEKMSEIQVDLRSARVTTARLAPAIDPQS